MVNLYVPKGETLKNSDSVDNISTDETGKVNIYENATTTKNEDGSITVTGDLVGIKQDGHSYELTATVEPPAPLRASGSTPAPPMRRDLRRDHQ